MIRLTLIATFAFSFLCSIAQGQSTYADSLQQIINLGRHDEGERKAYSLLASFYFRSDPQKAKRYMLQLVKLANEANDYFRQSSAHALLLAIYQDEGKLDSAVYTVGKLKEVAEKAPDDIKVQGNCNQAIGLYYKKREDFKNALPFALAAVEFAEKAKSDKPYIGGQWLNAGDVYRGLGDYKSAMDCNLKALAIFEETGHKRGQAFCYTNLSALYNLIRQYPNALKSAQKSYQLKKELSDNRGTCTALEAIGESYLNMKNYPQAYSNFDAALQIAIEEKMPMEQMVCYSNIGKIFAAEHKDSLAVFYINKSKALALQLDNKLAAADADLQLSALYKSSDSLKWAEQNLIKSLAAFKESGSLEKEADNYKRLSDFYAGNKQYDKALEYTKRYYAINDSIAGATVQVQLKKLEEEFQSAKKESEIAVLKKDKELQAQKMKQQQLLTAGTAVIALLFLAGIVLLRNRALLRQRMKELELRQRIAADLHDEVGSSLSSLHMLSQLVTEQEQNSSNKDLLSRMSNDAKETMERVGDIVWMIKPGDTEASGLRQRMERFAYEISSSKNIKTSINLDELDNLKLNMEQRKNIYLLFKEAINNAVKYSGASIINVIASVKNKTLTVEIKDEGKGFDAAVIKKGNGLDNMKNRAKELGGMLHIDSGRDNGTLIKLSVPV